MASSISEIISPTKLRIEGVAKTFPSKRGTTNALDNVSLDIKSGDFVCIVGPSGCGKTTLLRMVAGLETPSSGAILVNEKEVTKPGPDRTVLFQEAALFPWLTAIENVEFPLKLRKDLTKETIRPRALKYLSLMGLEDFAHRYIHELSGGMKQRVALARALAPGPNMLLLDEPFSALDAMTREQLYFDLQRIWEKYKTTIILVTHNVREAVSLGNRVLVMSPRPGKLRGDFTVSLPRPRDINDPKVSTIAQRVKEALGANTTSEGAI